MNQKEKKKRKSVEGKKREIKNTGGEFNTRKRKKEMKRKEMKNDEHEENPGRVPMPTEKKIK